MCKDKGITLIALIITIIILIILSAVTINNITGEHSLIDMATEAAIRTRIAQYKEELDQIGILIMTENTHNNLTGREYLEEFKKKVDNESEIFKNKKSAHIIEDEYEEKLRIVTKEGYIFDVTEKEIEYVGKVGDKGFEPMPELKEGSLKITLTPETEEGKWINQTLTVTIEVNSELEQDLSGFTIEYTTGDPTEKTGWTKYNDKDKPKMETNGIITARLKNNLGETSKTATAIVNYIDKIRPDKPIEITAVQGIENGKLIQSISVTVTAQDAQDTSGNGQQSGIYKLLFSTDGSSWNDVMVNGDANSKITTTYQLNVDTDGEYEVQVKAVDKAENESEVATSSKIKVDTTPPSAPTISINGEPKTGDAGEYSSDITVTITPGVDAMQPSKVRTMCIISGTQDTTYNWDGTSENIRVLSEDGYYEIIAMSTDASGNNSTTATVTVTKKNPTLVGKVQPSNYGDYIDYPVDLGIGSSGTQDDWRIFYNDGEHVFIIAADYVPNTNNTLTKSRGKARMANYSTYANYWSSDPGSQSQKIKQTELELFMETGYTLTSYKNSNCASQLLYTDNWADFANSTYADYAIGGSTIEMWCASWNAYLKVHPNSSFKEITAGGTSSYGYYVSSDSMKNQEYLYMNGTQASLTQSQLLTLQSDYSLYFPHSSVINSCYAYWLASPSAFTQYAERLIVVHCDGIVRHWDFYLKDIGLRPVVCLNPDVLANYDENQGLYILSK